MPTRSLFRSAAQDAQRVPMLGTILLIRPVSISVLVALSVASAVALVLFFSLGSYTRRITVEGTVMPDVGLVKVYAPLSGTVLRKLVDEEEHVSRGMVLYTLSADVQSAAAGGTQAALIEQDRRRRASLLDEIDKTRQLQQDDRRSLEEKRTSLRSALARLDQQLGEQRERAAIAADGVARYRRLSAQDYISTDQLQQREADLLDQRSRLLGLQRDREDIAQTLRESENALSGLALKQQNQLAQMHRAVMDVEQSAIANEARREFVVTAPEAGTATALVAEAGQAVGTQHPILSIVPDGARWRLHLLVPSSAIGFVHVGDTVKIRYRAYPYQKFGQYTGHVRSIALTALSAAELGAGSEAGASSAGTFYRIVVALDSQTVMAYGKPRPLQAGMTVQADLLQERRRLYEWVLEPLYSVTGKY
ncbi:HlyD family secretion protein [Burkholderia gladioli]|uniref:MFP transporter n=2 Tax=Burkholderia gladioli TaxID=28095 RepID=A0A2A7S460_BURGA|nr:HlyD family efflux transporter periplasmic adaptor subunit [Burkholderia gladioli]MBU9422886.1 HlyD family efflux transporter periplasmic adaptor subunit [Burkholderia gladioli]MDC6133740.1 HlyD family efflux transporter periplasmic adaptor subunit [Burkholderia gladioli]MDN8059749.1 HlyD family efflux transporter periplasmic adaptor subunit [Burkholderia gladioli]PEH38338.1 MFP transporter [Burkholderia gladioli]QPQ84706.1 HlyD family efflux transporter periplasmic adaptor subunit [Burkhol